VGQSWHQLPTIIDGDLEKIIKVLQEAERKE